MTSASNALPATLYLTRTGILEPLGESQVLAYLRGLSSSYQITLISLERQADIEDKQQLAHVSSICEAHGIRWIRLRYRRTPRIVAALLNLAVMIFHGWREARRADVKLIHARSYIPGVAAWLVSRVVGVPYIFDMRSLWPEELITSGRLRRGSLLHRLIFRAEGRLIGDAATVVSLTRAAVHYLRDVHPDRLSEARIAVIPTCTDLERFRPMGDVDSRDVLVGCHGSLLNGWFRIDLLAAVFSRLAERLPQARFEIITRENPDAIREALESYVKAGVMQADNHMHWLDHLSISAAKASEIHLCLQKQTLSTFFYASGEISELGRSPTRMGEALACGIPVLTNTGVGDVTETVRSGNVGVVIEKEDGRSLDQAADRVVALLADPGLAQRCRSVSDSVYSLKAGVDKYSSIYRQLAGH